MDKGSDMTATGIIEAAAKTEWQIGIERQLDSLSDANTTLSAQVNALRAELVMQSEVCSQRR